MLLTIVLLQLRQQQLHMGLARASHGMRQSSSLAARDHEGPLTSLATWPESGLLLSSVHTAQGSLPAESILWPRGLQPDTAQTWHAPVGCLKTDIHIMLPRLASVVCIRLCPGNVPYGKDTPRLQVGIGKVLSDLTECKVVKTTRQSNGDVDYEIAAPVEGCIVFLSLELDPAVAAEDATETTADHVEAETTEQPSRPCDSVHFYQQADEQGFVRVAVDDASGTSTDATAQGTGLTPQGTPAACGKVLRAQRVKVLGKVTHVVPHGEPGV